MTFLRLFLVVIAILPQGGLAQKDAPGAAPDKEAGGGQGDKEGQERVCGNQPAELEHPGWRFNLETCDWEETGEGGAPRKEDGILDDLSACTMLDGDIWFSLLSVVAGTVLLVLSVLSVLKMTLLFKNLKPTPALVAWGAICLNSVFVLYRGATFFAWCGQFDRPINEDDVPPLSLFFADAGIILALTVVTFMLRDCADVDSTKDKPFSKKRMIFFFVSTFLWLVLAGVAGPCSDPSAWSQTQESDRGCKWYGLGYPLFRVFYMGGITVGTLFFTRKLRKTIQEANNDPRMANASMLKLRKRLTRFSVLQTIVLLAFMGFSAFYSYNVYRFITDKRYFTREEFYALRTITAGASTGFNVLFNFGLAFLFTPKRLLHFNEESHNKAARQRTKESQQSKGSQRSKQSRQSKQSRSVNVKSKMSRVAPMEPEASTSPTGTQDPAEKV